MNKKFVLYVLVFGFVLLASNVYAEEGSPKTKNREENKNKVEEMQKMKEEKREYREEISKQKEEMKIEIENKREEMKGVISQKRVELESKLSKIKDLKKKDIVLSIDTHLGEINKKIVDRLYASIDRLEKMLSNTSDRINKLKEKGINVSTIEEKVTVAKTSVKEAKDAIVLQASKIYEIQITDEVSLKEKVKITKDTLHKDLKSVQEKVKKAHEDIRAVYKEMGLLSGDDTNKDNTEEEKVEKSEKTQ